MRKLSVFVFSRTLEHALWNNTRLTKGDLAGEIRRMKDEPGPDMVILGSGSIVAQLALEHLIDDKNVSKRESPSLFRAGGFIGFAICALGGT